MSTVTTTRVFGGTTLIVLVLALIGIMISAKPGFGQNQKPGMAAPCPFFQQTVTADIIGGASFGTIRVSPRTTATIEQIALRIDAIDTIVPAVAAVTTTVQSVRGVYYLPILTAEAAVSPARPLTLMERVQLHADGGTDIVLSLDMDSRFPRGAGRAQWSVSGLSCSDLR
jgi:hypothetical protein